MVTENNSFEYQYYYKRWLCGLPVLIFVLLLNTVLIKIIDNAVLFYLTTAFITVLFLTAYYKLTENRFVGKGRYYKQDDLKIIEFKNKKYYINQIKEVSVDTKNIYSNRFAVLSIATDKETIKIFSTQIKNRDKFEDTSLFGLYNFILNEDV